MSAMVNKRMKGSTLEGDSRIGVRKETNHIEFTNVPLSPFALGRDRFVPNSPTEL